MFSSLFLSVLLFPTYHIKYLCESDANPDLDGLAGVDDGPHLPVVVVHEVAQQPALLLRRLPPPGIRVVSRIFNYKCELVSVFVCYTPATRSIFLVFPSVKTLNFGFLDILYVLPTTIWLCILDHILLIYLVRNLA